MAKVKDKVVYPYPTYFGSHTSMVETEETERLADPGLVVCKDEFGLYVTERKRLDDGMADGYRNATPEWRENKMQVVLGQVFDIVG